MIPTNLCYEFCLLLNSFKFYSFTVHFYDMLMK
jgi:hypothetical protein